MTSTRHVSRIIGMLLLVHLATGLIVPYVLLQPLTRLPAAFLDTAAGMSSQVRLNVFLLFVGGAISVGISIAAWPVVRERSYRLGLCLLGTAVRPAVGGSSSCLRATWSSCSRLTARTLSSGQPVRP